MNGMLAKSVDGRSGVFHDFVSPGSLGKVFVSVACRTVNRKVVKVVVLMVAIQMVNLKHLSSLVPSANSALGFVAMRNEPFAEFVKSGSLAVGLSEDGVSGGEIFSTPDVPTRLANSALLGLFAAIDAERASCSHSQSLPNSPKESRGQYRANGAVASVCNEQVPAAKAKVCSELTGNRESTAEMTVPHESAVTACYNQTLLSTVRYINPTQKADLTFGGLYYQDMPWYWDRNCPSGRIYVLNTKYVHFYIDPLMFFRWSESRTWPNQLVDIRILSLRMALVWKSRMFHTVLDGWTA